MSDEEDIIAPLIWERLKDDDHAYRLLDSPTWISPEGELTTLAFKLKVKDEGCLSMRIRANRTEEQLLDEDPKARLSCKGVARFIVKSFREPIADYPELIDIFQDEPFHASVLGLPPCKEEDDSDDAEITREYVASQLAKRMNNLWDLRKKKSTA